MKQHDGTKWVSLQLAMCFLIMFFLTSCGDEKPKEADIVARVEDQYLTRDLLLRLTPDNLRGEQRELFIKRIVEQWVDNQVLALKAVENSLLLSVEDEWQIENLEVDMLASKYLNNQLNTNFSITDKDVEDYYKENAAAFVRQNDEVHLVHTYFEQRDQAIFKEIKRAKLLMDVINNNQLNERQLTYVAEPNGDLGYKAVAELHAAFQKAIRGKKTGLIYGPIKTKDGYHFLQVLDRKAAGSLRNLELVEKEIVAHLKLSKRHRRLKQIKERARKDFTVETFYQNIL